MRAASAADEGGGVGGGPVEAAVRACWGGQGQVRRDGQGESGRGEEGKAEESEMEKHLHNEGMGGGFFLGERA